MTFTPGTKVRYNAVNGMLRDLNGLEGVVVQTKGNNTTMLKVTKDASSGRYPHLLGEVTEFSTDNLVSVSSEKREWAVGDRVKVNDSGNYGTSPHHGLVGVITEVGTEFRGTVIVEIDEDCEAFRLLKNSNPNLTVIGWYLKTSTLEPVEEEDGLKEGGVISYEQVERGQRIRVSYESRGVIHSREGVVGHVSQNTNTDRKVNWTINVLDDEKARYNDKGQRLNWGSDKQKETIVLLENVPEVDTVLERLLESEGGTVIRAFGNQLLVREAFSDFWKSLSADKVYSSETLRQVTGGKITFFVEDTEGN